MGSLSTWHLESRQILVWLCHSWGFNTSSQTGYVHIYKPVLPCLCIKGEIRWSANRTDPLSEGLQRVESTATPFTEQQWWQLVSPRVSCPFRVSPEHKGRQLCMPAGAALAFKQCNHPFHCFQLPCSPLHAREGLGADPGVPEAQGWGSFGWDICCPGYVEQLLGSFCISTSSHQELQHW